MQFMQISNINRATKLACQEQEAIPYDVIPQKRKRFRDEYLVADKHYHVTTRDY